MRRIEISSITNEFIVIAVDNNDIPAFKEMVNRALNCWDKAPPELKSFADRLILGYEQQDYHNISTPKQRPDQ